MSNACPDPAGLSLDEALLLARELPHLRELIQAQAEAATPS